MMRLTRLLQLAQIAVFAGCVAIPLTLFGLGQRGESIANRRPAPLPALSALSLFDTDTTAAFDAYVDDAFPFVDEAVRLNARTDQWFGDSSNPDVVVAADGWLYLRESVDQNCLTPSELDQLADALDRADRVVSSTGRTLINVIAPDKASIFPANLASPPDCVLANADRLSALDTNAVVLTAWDETRDAAGRDDTVYRRLDTHWSADGATPAARALIDVLAPGLWSDDFVVRSARRDAVGDLTVLLGLPRGELTSVASSVPWQGAVDATAIPVVDRHGAVVEGVPAATYRSDWPLGIGAPTVLLHDSFGPRLIEMASGYFRELSTVGEPSPNSWFARPLVQAAEVIVRLDAQRSFFDVVIGPDLAAQMAAALADELPALEATATCDGSCRVTWARPPTGSDVYVIATLDADHRTARIGSGERTFVLTDAAPWAAWHAAANGALLVDGDTDVVRFSVVVVP